jgi:hypothetical protein
MKGTKLSFLRDLLSDKKQPLKRNEIIFLSVPNYKEISVTNLYDDAIKDPVLKKYLPDKN